MPRMRFVVALVAFSAVPVLAVGPTHSSLANDPEFRSATALIEAGRFAEAIPLLKSLEKDFPVSADVQNLLGVSHRKLKDYATAKRHYDRALELDSEHLPTLEYQGEWFIETGDIESARRNLARLKALCGECHEYRDLAESLAKVGAR